MFGYGPILCDLYQAHDKDQGQSNMVMEINTTTYYISLLLCLDFLYASSSSLYHLHWIAFLSLQLHYMIESKTNLMNLQE